MQKTPYIKKETPDYVLVQVVNPGERSSPTWTDPGYVSKERKFLCVGGPSDKQKKASIQIEKEDYVPYNSASGGRRGWTRNKKHTQLWIHQSLLT